MKVEPTGSTAPHAPTREPSYLPDEALSRVAKRRHNPIQLPHDALRCIIDPRVRWGGLPVPGGCDSALLSFRLFHATSLPLYSGSAPSLSNESPFISVWP